MIAAGVNAKALSVYMGHASIEITYDRYGHLMPGNEAEAAGLLDDYLIAAGEEAADVPTPVRHSCASRRSRERLAAVRRRGRSGDLGTNRPQEAAGDRSRRA